jgi:hypothetical protein
VSALRNAIIDHLKTDAAVVAAATGGIWPGLPPKGRASYPFISVTTRRGASPERNFRGAGTPADEIAFERATFLVKAIDKNTSPKAASDIKELARTALDGAEVAVTGYTLISCQWVGDIPGYPELDDSTHYQHEGALVEIWATKN